MTDAVRQGDEPVSLFALGTMLLRHRTRILRWMVFGGIAAGVLVIFRPPMYASTASFVPQGSDAGRSGLASLAGQFGVALPSGNPSLSPDFYVRLLKSRVLLSRVVRDTLNVAELAGARVTFFDLFKIDGGTAAGREERGIEVLADLISTSVAKSTGIVELSVMSRWPSVSNAIATALVSGVNEVNLQTRQGQAASERKFLEGRLVLARSELRAAEDRLEDFLRSNRQSGNSPELTFQRERLQRDISIQQQVYTALIQSFEDARIREVRDTPLITMLEPPSMTSQPESRGRIKGTLLGALLGGFVGALLALMSEMLVRRRQDGDVEAEVFVSTLQEAWSDIRRRVRWVR